MKNFWNGHNVLITGADGFIGSHLTEKLISFNANVTALTYYNSRGSNGWLDSAFEEIPNNLKIRQGDIRDPHFVDSIIGESSTVFHLSSLIAIPYSYKAYQSYIDTNITGLSNLLTSCRRHDVQKIVHTSTSEVYGSALYTPIDEKHPLQGQSPYSGSKIAADMIADSFFRSFDLPITTARPFNTYGPRQSLRAVIPSIIQQLIKKENGSFLDIGDLSPKRDFNFVLDTVDGFLSLGEAENVIGKVFNIGSAVDISIKELCEILFDISGTELKYKTDSKRLRPEKSEVNRLLCDSSLIYKTTGWKSKTDLHTGLKTTYDWFKLNSHEYGKETFLL
jgi:NAD dependent epimerase/dehydratase